MSEDMGMERLKIQTKRKQGNNNKQKQTRGNRERQKSLKCLLGMV